MKRQKEVLVGLVMVLGIVMAVGGTLWLQGTDLFRDATEVEAEFRDIGMVTEGNRVTLRGVNIGRVREVRVAPGGQTVRVRLRIDPDVSLPRDAAVILAPESMFGDWQAEIVSREEFAQFRYTEPVEADVLPGYALPDITRLTASADRIGENLADLTDRVSIAFSEETARNVAGVVENIEGVSQRLSDLVDQQAAAFLELTDELEVVAQEIGRAASAARVTFEGVDDLVGSEEVRSILTELHATTVNARTLAADLQQTNQEVRRMAGRVDQTFDRVERMTERLERGEGTVGRLLVDQAVSDDVQTALLELQMLLEDVRENPRRYLRLSIF